MREKPSPEEQDSEDEDESTASESEEPEYSFAGFNVEFSEKIALTPLAVAESSAREKGRVRP